MTERIPSFGPLPEAEEFSADILPEVKKPDPVVEQNPFDESLLSSVIESATEQRPMEQSLDMAHEGVALPAKQKASYQPMQSVGSILGQSPAIDQQGFMNPNDYGSAGRKQTDSLGRGVVSASPSAGLSYRQAVRYGFFGAVFIAVIFMVVIY